MSVVVSSLSSWLRRHRRKFFWLGAITGSVVIVGKLAEARFYTWQQNQTRSLFDRAKKQHHFESTHRTGNLTLHSLFPDLITQILASLDSESLLKKLAKEDITSEEKLQLWNKLKVVSFARVSVYCLGGVQLSILLQTLISILGGYLYQQQTAEPNSQANIRLTQRVQESFLQACGDYIQEEIPALCTRLLQKCENKLQDVPLKKNISLVDIEAMLREILIPEVHVDSVQLLRLQSVNWDGLEAGESDVLKRLYADAMDVIENEDYRNIQSTCLSIAFGHVLDRLGEQVHIKTAQKQEAKVVDLNDTKLPVAKFVPMLSGLVVRPQSVKEEAQGYQLDSLLVLLLKIEAVSSFAANIYETFCQPASSRSQPREEHWASFPWSYLDLQKGKDIWHNLTSK